MRENNQLTVEASEFGHIPEGATLTVEWDNVNEFTGKRTLRVTADVSIPNVIDGSSIQLFRMPDQEVWTEVHVGLSREHEKVKLA